MIDYAGRISGCVVVLKVLMFCRNNPTWALTGTLNIRLLIF
jgi:hypothetical protein